jgi:hypothetical protein
MCGKQAIIRVSADAGSRRSLSGCDSPAPKDSKSCTGASGIKYGSCGALGVLGPLMHSLFCIDHTKLRGHFRMSLWSQPWVLDGCQVMFDAMGPSTEHCF